MDEGYVRACRKDNLVIWGGNGCLVEDVSTGLPGWVAEPDISVT